MQRMKIEIRKSNNVKRLCFTGSYIYSLNVVIFLVKITPKFIFTFFKFDKVVVSHVPKIKRGFKVNSLYFSLSILFLFCWCLNIYGQESLTDSTAFIYTDVIYYVDYQSTFINPKILEFIKFYEKYETECFNDSTKQCFNYFTYLNLIYYKTPCSKGDIDLRSGVFIETGEEWVHVQPSFIGFMQWMKKRIE